jgi:hypothetical protein
MKMQRFCGYERDVFLLLMHRENGGIGCIISINASKTRPLLGYYTFFGTTTLLMPCFTPRASYQTEVHRTLQSCTLARLPASDRRLCVKCLCVRRRAAGGVEACPSRILVEAERKVGLLTVIAKCGFIVLQL